MRRLMLAGLALGALACTALSQELATNCSQLGKVARYFLVANQENGIPTFKYQLLPVQTTCFAGDKSEYMIASAERPLGSDKDARAVINAVRELVRTGFTDPEDLKRVIKYVAEVEAKDAARPSKKVADKAPQAVKEGPDQAWPWVDQKKK